MLKLEENPLATAPVDSGLRNRRLLAICLITAIGLLAPCPARAQEEVKGPLVIGTELDYPPFSRSNVEGDPVGLNVDIVRALGEVLDVEIELRIDTWSRILTGLVTGDLDAIAGMYRSPERDRQFDFSEPFAVVEHTVFSRRDAAPVEGLEDLAGESILVMRGDIMHDVARGSPFLRNLVPTTTQAEALRLLSGGVGTYALVARYPGLYWIDELGLTNLVEQPFRTERIDYCLAVREGESTLLSLLDEGLAELRANGRYRELYERRIGYLERRSIFEDKIVRTTGIALAVAAVILLAGFFWIRSLRRLVRQRTGELEQIVEDQRDTEHRLAHSVAVLSAVREVGRLITHEQDRARLLSSVCTLLTDARDYHYAWIALFEDGVFETLFHSHSGGDFDAMESMLSEGDIPRCIGAAFASESTVVTHDPGAECPGCPLASAYNDAGALSVALRTGDRLYGVMSVSLPSEFLSTVEEAVILSELADDIVLALEKLSLESGQALLVERLSLANRIVRNSPIVLFHWSPEPGWPVLYVSENAENLGMGREDLLSGDRTYESYVHPEDRERVGDEVSRMSASGRAEFQHIYRIVDDAEDVRWVEDRTSILRDDSGAVVGFEGVVVDITSRRVSEELLNTRFKYEVALARCSRLLLTDIRGAVESSFPAVLEELRTATETSRVYVFENEVDPAGRLCMSQRFEACAPGVEPQISNPELQRLPYEEGFDRWRRALETGSPVAGRVNEFPESEQTILIEQGIRSLLVLPILSSGSLYGFVGFDDVARDRDWRDEDIRILRTAAQMMGAYIERGQRERARLALERRVMVSQKQQSLGEMAGAIAHHYNNLFTALLGNLALAREAVRESVDGREFVDRAEEQAERGVALSRQMLTYVGQGTHAMRPADLSTVAESAAFEVKKPSGKGIRFRSDFAHGLPRITCDSEAIRRLVENLVLNAFESLPPSGGTVRITTGAVERIAVGRDDTPDESEIEPGTYVYLEITDNGIGLTESQQARMFDPFYSTKFVGRGLGLAAVRGIVRAHGSAVLVDSRSGEGTTIRVLFRPESAEESVS